MSLQVPFLPPFSAPFEDVAGIYPIPYTPWHWDADRLETLFSDTGKTNPIDGVSGNGIRAWNNYLIADGGDARPTYRTNRLNGKAIVEFNAGGGPPPSHMYAATAADLGNFSTSQLSLFTVMSFRSRTHLSGIFAFAPAAGNDFGAANSLYLIDNQDLPAAGSGEVEFARGTGNKIQTDGRDLGTDVYYLLEAHITATNRYLYLDGELVDSVAVAASTITPAIMMMGARIIGGADSLHGDLNMAEFILYDRALSSSELLFVREYLQDKWLPNSPFLWEAPP
jgi:hypothetical protein